MYLDGQKADTLHQEVMLADKYSLTHKSLFKKSEGKSVLLLGNKHQDKVFSSNKAGGKCWWTMPAEKDHEILEEENRVSPLVSIVNVNVM